MAKVAAAAAAMDSGPNHAEGSVLLCADSHVQRRPKLGQPVPLSYFVVEEKRS